MLIKSRILSLLISNWNNMYEQSLFYEWIPYSRQGHEKQITNDKEVASKAIKES